MRIYLDDNRADRALAAMLKHAGHVVVRPREVKRESASDASHLEYAITKKLVVLTADRDDFRELHQLVLSSGGSHPGITVVRYDNNPRKDMKPKHIVRAVGNLESSGTLLAGEFINLNQWR